MSDWTGPDQRSAYERRGQHLSLVMTTFYVLMGLGLLVFIVSSFVDCDN